MRYRPEGQRKIMQTKESEHMADQALAVHLEAMAVAGKAPLWVGVVLYAMAHADSRGHAELRPGQLRAALAPDRPRERISEAIRRGVRARCLHPDSTAWHLVVMNRG
jgi:hypothetical protein